MLEDINDSRAKRCHYLIAEMIAIDDEPLSMVNYHVGFRILLQNPLLQYCIPGRTRFTHNVVPDIYERVVIKKREI